jgi:hypothetical protein
MLSGPFFDLADPLYCTIPISGSRSRAVGKHGSKTREFVCAMLTPVAICTAMIGSTPALRADSKRWVHENILRCAVESFIMLSDALGALLTWWKNIQIVCQVDSYFCLCRYAGLATSDLTMSGLQLKASTSQWASPNSCIAGWEVSSLKERLCMIRDTGVVIIRNILPCPVQFTWVLM